MTYFHIHVDAPNYPDSVKLIHVDLLQTVGLNQHITKPTQIQGHTLDVLITRSCDDTLNKANVVDRFISDHAFVYCTLLQDRPADVTAKSIAYRKLKPLIWNLFGETYRTPCYAVTCKLYISTQKIHVTWMLLYTDTTLHFRKSLFVTPRVRLRL